MEILALGHSSFVLGLAGPDGALVRILADPWLSDYGVGDLMGRFPRLDLDPAALGRVLGFRPAADMAATLLAAVQRTRGL